MPNNETTAKQYVSLESLSVFLENIKTAYRTNTSNANEKFPVHYSETAGSADSASQLNGNITFKDSSDNTIGTWVAGQSEIVLTVTGGGSLPEGVTILKFKGVKPTRAALDNLAAEAGDVWIIESDNSEYIWVPTIPAEGEEGQEGYKPEVDAHWEQLGATMDLSSYITRDEMDLVTAEDINALFVEPEPEPRLISMSGIYKKGLKDATSEVNNNQHIIITDPDYIWTDLDEIPAEYKYSGLYWAPWGEDKYVLGNTSLIADWGYNGQAVETNCPICIITINNGEVGGRAIVVMSDDVYDEQAADYTFNDYQIIDDHTSSTSYQGSAKNFIYSDSEVNWSEEDYTGLIKAISDDDVEYLKANVGKNIKLTLDGVEYDAEISYDENYDQITFNTNTDVFAGIMKYNGDSSYYFVADKSDFNNPSTLENNEQFSASINLDSIT